jgi:SPP1 family predicted phage head-tail adaptor
MAAGKLRHRCRIEQKTQVQDPATGAVSTVWSVYADNVPCSIEPLSGREFVSASEYRSKVAARVVLRWRPGLEASMRLINLADNAQYQVEGVLPDPVSGREYVTLPISWGTNDGG